KEAAMAHILVIGGGLGGVPMALEARETVRKEDRVTLLSDMATFHFTPSNPWVAVGWRKPEQIKVPLGPMCRRRGIEFVHGRAAKIRPQDNAVELSNGETLTYDYLVIATGPELAFDEIE